MKNNLTILIPVHEFNDEISGMLKSAISSCLTQNKIKNKPLIKVVTNIISYDKVVEFIKKNEYEIEVLKNENNSKFQSQINFGVEYIDTKYFMILEMDDEINLNYLDRFNKYEKEKKDVSVYLNILIEVDKENKPIRLINEYAYSKQFYENNEMGYLNIDALKQYSDFNISGAIIDTKFYKSVGGLKQNIELTFSYEFFLRVLNNNGKIFVIPKIGCKHMNGRDGSLFNFYKTNMSIKERGFWFETAKKEYYFTNDRNIEKNI